MEEGEDEDEDEEEEGGDSVKGALRGQAGRGRVYPSFRRLDIKQERRDAELKRVRKQRADDLAAARALAAELRGVVDVGAVEEMVEKPRCGALVHL